MNTFAAFFRHFGVFSGFVGTTCVLFLLIVISMKLIDSMSGNYIDYDFSVFQRMIFITSDAYYDWVKKDYVTKADVAKLDNYITLGNNRIRIINTNGLENDTSKITKLIETYNNDVAASSFVTNQMFLYTCFILFLITIPYVFIWSTMGLVDASFVFEALCPSGIKGFNMSYHGMPLLIAVLTFAFFITTMIYVFSRKWYHTADSKKKPEYWPSTENPGSETSPNKENAEYNIRKFKTLRFLTANGTATASLDQDNQDKRLLTAGSIFNPNAFHRSRVLFITNGTDLGGYYKQFVYGNTNIPSTEDVLGASVDAKKGQM